MYEWDQDHLGGDVVGGADKRLHPADAVLFAWRARFVLPFHVDEQPELSVLKLSVLSLHTPHPSALNVIIDLLRPKSINLICALGACMGETWA